MARAFVWIIGTAITLAVLGWLGWLLFIRISDALEEGESGRQSRAVAVEIAEVERGTIRDIRRFTGTIRPRSEVEIAPRIAGRLKRLYVDIGDTVQRGELIAELDDEEYLQDVEAARADLLVTEATLDEKRSALQTAERDYERSKRLREQRIASESELDAARSRFEAEQAGVRVAEAEVTRRQAALRSAEIRLSYTRILANWETGGEVRVVSERYAEEGATVAANTRLLSLIDLDTLRAVIFVTERDHRPLRIGMEAELTSDSRSDELHTGRIVRMSPAFQEGSRQARVEIELPNPDHALKPGMFVRTQLELERDDDAWIIPRQALLTRDDVTGVFVVDRDEMTAHFVPLTIGIRERTRVQVLEPELNGPVVVLGQHLLDDGAEVSIPDEDGAEVADRSDQTVISGALGRSSG